jgi:hypothetical protein
MKIPSISTTEGAKVWMYYGNSSVSSVSNGDDTFLSFFDGDSTGWTEVDPNSHIAFANNRLEFTGLARNEDAYVYQAIETDDNIIIEWDHQATSGHISGIAAYGILSDMLDDFVNINNGFGAYGYSTNVYIRQIIRVSDASYSGIAATVDDSIHYCRETRVGNTVTTNVYTDADRTNLDASTTKTQAGLPTLNYVMIVASWNSAEAYDISGWLDNFKVRKYTATEPTWAADGEEQTAPGSTNITASITGDSNEQSYNTSQSREFTLTPTGATNNVIINTTSTDYDITIITYWTKDTTLIEETVSSGYVKQYINYTPSANITSAVLNSTILNDLTAHDYLGTTTSTLNDVSKTTTSVGQEVNASVGSLTKYVEYLWNITIPYNNAPTISVSNQQFSTTENINVVFIATDTENDLTISGTLNGVTKTTTSPHIFGTLAAGTYTYYLNVTEDATTHPQTSNLTATIIISTPELTGTFLYPNSTGSTGQYGKLLTEMIYANGFNLSDISTGTELTETQLNYLSADDTDYINLDKTAANDGYLYVNFSLSDVGDIDLIDVTTVHNRNFTNPVILGLYNYSCDQWENVSYSASDVGDIEMTYRIDDRELSHYVKLIDGEMSLSVSLNTNGDENEDVFIDMIKVYLEYDEYSTAPTNEELYTKIQNLYLFVFLCTVFLFATVKRKRE